MTVFVEMYHPLFADTVTNPKRVAERAVDDYAALGWLRADAGALPTPSTPYYTTAAADSRFAKADPVLSNFSYDPTTGNLMSYQEDGVTITLTYNPDGTVATSRRGAAPVVTYSYAGGNLVGVA
jgi:hypothetical protein